MKIEIVKQKIQELDSKMSLVLEEDISTDYRIHVEGIRQGLSWALREIDESGNE